MCRLFLGLPGAGERVVARRRVATGKGLRHEDVDRGAVLRVHHHHRAVVGSGLHRAQDLAVVAVEHTGIGHEQLEARDAFGHELVHRLERLVVDTTDDLVVAEKLLAVGCEVLMPWGAPIGSGKGLNNRFGLKAMRAHFPGVPLVVDAGLGVPSHAADAMELGYDAVLLNTAVAKAGDPAGMAEAFALAVKAGRLAYLSGAMEARDMAVPSTPVFGQPFV